MTSDKRITPAVTSLVLYPQSGSGKNRPINISKAQSTCGRCQYQYEHAHGARGPYA